MKGKPDILYALRNLLIAFIVLIVVAVVAFAVLSYCSCVKLNEEDRMILAVRYIGLVQPDAFYEEVMGCPDGYLRASDLKTKLATPPPETPETYGYRYLRSGPELLREYAGHVYVKKEGRFLCVAVVTTPKWSILHPGRTNWAERFEIFEQTDPESGKTVYYAADRDHWKIDAADMLRNGWSFGDGSGLRQ